MPNTSSMDIVVARGRPQTRQDSPVLVDGWVRAPTAAPNRIRKSATKSANERGRKREHHQERPEESGHSAVNGRAEFAVFAQEREEGSQGCPSDAYLTRESGRPHGSSSTSAGTPSRAIASRFSQTVCTSWENRNARRRPVTSTGSMSAVGAPPGTAP